MSRRAYPSRTLAAAVRTHFGLTQAELAAFVGVSRSHLAMHEAGTKTPGPDQRLQVLARQLPPPDGLGPPAPGSATSYRSATSASTAASGAAVSAVGPCPVGLAALAARICCTSAAIAACSASVAAGMGSL